MDIGSVIAGARAAMAPGCRPATGPDNPTVRITIAADAPHMRALLRAMGSLLEYAGPELTLVELEVSR